MNLYEVYVGKVMKSVSPEPPEHPDRLLITGTFRSKYKYNIHDIYKLLCVF